MLWQMETGGIGGITDGEGGGENCLVFFSQFLKAVDCDEEKSTKDTTR